MKGKLLTLAFILIVAIALLGFAQDLDHELSVPEVNTAVDALTFWN